MNLNPTPRLFLKILVLAWWLYKHTISLFPMGAGKLTNTFIEIIFNIVVPGIRQPWHDDELAVDTHNTQCHWTNIQAVRHVCLVAYAKKWHANVANISDELFVSPTCLHAWKTAIILIALLNFSWRLLTVSIWVPQFTVSWVKRCLVGAAAFSWTNPLRLNVTWPMT